MASATPDKHDFVSLRDLGVAPAAREKSAVAARLPFGVGHSLHFGPPFLRVGSCWGHELRALLVVIGDEAVESVTASYERSGWLEKVSAGLVSRYNNRRVQISLALGELGTPPAIAALRSLHRREKDDNLRIHLDRSLHMAQENRV